jgi:hypothetical protein
VPRFDVWRLDLAHSKQRPLTAGEIGLARAAFGGTIDYARVRMSDGADVNPIAHIAFFMGNPAIALGSTVYFGRDFCPDFSAPGRDRRTFIHEMAHVWQYRIMGMAAFFLRYAFELVKAGGRPRNMYLYVQGVSTFGEAMLEAQAEMAADFGEALWTRDGAREALIAKNLAASGIYGL